MMIVVGERVDRVDRVKRVERVVVVPLMIES